MAYLWSTEKYLEGITWDSSKEGRELVMITKTGAGGIVTDLQNEQKHMFSTIL